MNRPDNLLKKGGGYHLDLAVLAVLIVVCAAFGVYKRLQTWQRNALKNNRKKRQFSGLPFFVAATVLSVAHLDALKIHSQAAAPGEQPQFFGIK